MLALLLHRTITLASLAVIACGCGNADQRQTGSTSAHSSVAAPGKTPFPDELVRAKHDGMMTQPLSFTKVVAESARMYARPGADGKPLLCKSAAPDPRPVPSSWAEMTSSDPRFSFGDARTGWACLKLGFRLDANYRYGYVAGGPYRSVERGGRDPGPDGFEVCGEADFLPGGPTTLVCRTGWIDKTNQIVLSERAFVDDEFTE